MAHGQLRRSAGTHAERSGCGGAERGGSRLSLAAALTQQVELIHVQDAAVRLSQQARLEHRLALLSVGQRRSGGRGRCEHPVYALSAYTSSLGSPGCAAGHPEVA